MIFLYKDISKNVPKFEKGSRRLRVKSCKNPKTFVHSACPKAPNRPIRAVGVKLQHQLNNSRIVALALDCWLNLNPNVVITTKTTFSPLVGSRRHKK